jgi:hypothetical protein
MDRDRIEALLALFEEQPWLECRELKVEEAEPGRFALAGEVAAPHLEGVERLSYLVSDVATLCREEEDPALAWARLHAEMLPCPGEEEEFPFRLWTDPLPAPSFARLTDVISEAMQLGDEGEDEDLGNGFIQIDEL